MSEILIIFVALSIVNVVFSTIRSITTIKSGKFVASLVSGGYFAFYNVMLIYTVLDFPMWQKCVITFVCNLIGVFVVKLVEEKIRKDRLWKVELTVPNENAESLAKELEHYSIPHNYINGIGRYTLFNTFCYTKKDSHFVKQIADRHSAKYFASESEKLI